MGLGYPQNGRKSTRSCKLAACTEDPGVEQWAALLSADQQNAPIRKLVIADMARIEKSSK